jgi:hypothetical protein
MRNMSDVIFVMFNIFCLAAFVYAMAYNTNRGKKLWKEVYYVEFIYLFWGYIPQLQY